MDPKVRLITSSATTSKHLSIKLTNAFDDVMREVKTLDDIYNKSRIIDQNLPEMQQEFEDFAKFLYKKYLAGCRYYL